MSGPTLRTYAFIDRMQPQCAAHIAATSPGDVPLAGMAELYIEMAPGNEVFRAADIALKASGVPRPCRSSSASSGCWRSTPSSRRRCSPPGRRCSTSSA